MQDTGLFTHPACLEHLTPPGHPERVERLEAICSELARPEFARVIRLDAPPATREALLRAHSPDLVDRILEAQIGESRFLRIDPDTAMSQGSREAALRAAGAVISAVEQVMAGNMRNAFCAVRPPGHHAERTRAMGFCLFNNVAIAALHARAKHGLNRIAVVDFDVHHGNGTQDIFFDDPNLFYASTHQFPLYPGTGLASERGVSGNIVNAPLTPGSGGDEFRRAFQTKILPALDSFKPEFILISAGFDAHIADPLANLCFEAEDFAWATTQLCALAARLCQSRVVSALEGGYNLDALRQSAAAHVLALMHA
jgi:acetoin utilization deacetylase AcuC-like enzyme